MQTRASLQRRVKTAGSWGPWTNLSVGPWSNSLTTYQEHRFFTTDFGVYDEVEFRILTGHNWVSQNYGINDPGLSAPVQNNAWQYSLAVKAVIK